MPNGSTSSSGGGFSGGFGGGLSAGVGGGAESAGGYSQAFYKRRAEQRKAMQERAAGPMSAPVPTTQPSAPTAAPTWGAPPPWTQPPAAPPPPIFQPPPYAPMMPAPAPIEKRAPLQFGGRPAPTYQYADLSRVPAPPRGLGADWMLDVPKDTSGAGARQAFLAERPGLQRQPDGTYRWRQPEHQMTAVEKAEDEYDPPWEDKTKWRYPEGPGPFKFTPPPIGIEIPAGPTIDPGALRSILPYEGFHSGDPDHIELDYLKRRFAQPPPGGFRAYRDMSKPVLRPAPPVRSGGIDVDPRFEPGGKYYEYDPAWDEPGWRDPDEVVVEVPAELLKKVDKKIADKVVGDIEEEEEKEVEEEVEEEVEKPKVPSEGERKRRERLAAEAKADVITDDEKKEFKVWEKELDHRQMKGDLKGKVWGAVPWVQRAVGRLRKLIDDGKGRKARDLKKKINNAIATRDNWLLDFKDKAKKDAAKKKRISHGGGGGGGGAFNKAAAEQAQRNWEEAMRLLEAARDAIGNSPTFKSAEALLMAIMSGTGVPFNDAMKAKIFGDISDRLTRSMQEEVRGGEAAIAAAGLRTGPEASFRGAAAQRAAQAGAAATAQEATRMAEANAAAQRQASAQAGQLAVQKAAQENAIRQQMAQMFATRKYPAYV